MPTLSQVLPFFPSVNTPDSAGLSGEVTDNTLKISLHMHVECFDFLWDQLTGLQPSDPEGETNILTAKNSTTRTYNNPTSR
jgi:hypothetical protein